MVAWRLDFVYFEKIRDGVQGQEKENYTGSERLLHQMKKKGHLA